jgi:hypothetical protein
LVVIVCSFEASTYLYIEGGRAIVTKTRLLFRGSPDKTQEEGLRFGFSGILPHFEEF